MGRKPIIAVVGTWKDDPYQMPQLYEFKAWREALEFCKKWREDFKLMYHLHHF